MLIKKKLSSLLCIVIFVLAIIFSFSSGAVLEFYKDYYTINTTADIVNALSKQGVRKYAYVEHVSELLIPTGLGYLKPNNEISKLFYISKLDDKYMMCLLDAVDINTFSSDISQYHIKGIARSFEEDELSLLKNILINDYDVPYAEIDKYISEYMLDDTLGKNLYSVRLFGLILLAIILSIIIINILEVRKCLMNTDGHLPNE